jgi:membrane protein DedA with SNARE-associated domain
MNLENIQPWLEWLQTHAQLAGIITCGIAFLECLTIVGLFMPGVVIMTALGMLVGMGVLSFISITLWCALGAFLGDSVSFALGKKYQGIRERWPFSRYPNLLKRGEIFFKTHGGKSIFIGRFVGPIRPILPLIAGMMNMPTGRFLIVDGISAILWGPVYMSFGIVLGHTSQQLPPKVAMRWIFFIILLLLLAWIIWILIRSSYVWISTLLDRKIAKLWTLSHRHPQLKGFINLITNPNDHHNHTQLSLALSCLICSLLFLILSYSITHHGITLYWNEIVNHWMRSLRNVHLDSFFIVITLISPTVLWIVWMSLLVDFLFNRFYRLSLHWFLLGILTFVGGELIKHWFHFPRPVGIVRIPNGASFPSGHTLTFVSLFSFLLMLFTDRRSIYLKRLVMFGAGLLGFLLIISRLYLNAHWLSDIMGGIFLGLSFSAAVMLSYRRKINPLIPKNLFFIAPLVLGIAWSVAVYKNFSSAKKDYSLTQSHRPTPKLPSWQVQLGTRSKNL